MQYILIYSTEGGWSRLTQAEQEAGMAAYMSYTEALKKAGVLAGVNRLQPTQTATTVRLANGKPQVLDGPYADSKEQLGGYYVIDVPDLDAAMAGPRLLSPLHTGHVCWSRAGLSRRNVGLRGDLCAGVPAPTGSGVPAL